MKAKFKLFDLVLYRKGHHTYAKDTDEYQLGIIKEVITKQYPDGSVSFSYRVWYHTGDTPALTDEGFLYPISNAYSYLVLRRKVDTSSINETPSRQLAASIIDGIPQLSELKGEPYYECEDALTVLINEFKI